MHVVLVLFLALAFDPSCALTERSKPLEVSFYTPERVRTESATSRPPTGPALRLGRVSSGVGLGERIAYRDGQYEVGYYDGRRWTERPEVYVRRALTRTLFEEGGLDRALSESAPTLDVEVTASFEEVKMPTAHAAQHRAARRPARPIAFCWRTPSAPANRSGESTFRRRGRGIGARAPTGPRTRSCRRVRAGLSAATVAPGSP